MVQGDNLSVVNDACQAGKIGIGSDVKIGHNDGIEERRRLNARRLIDMGTDRNGTGPQAQGARKPGEASPATTVFRELRHCSVYRYGDRHLGIPCLADQLLFELCIL